MGIMEDIASLKIQGATNISIASLRHLEKFSEKSGFGKEFELEAKRIAAVRPTAVMFHNILEILLKNRNIETIHSLLERLDNDRRMIAYHGRKLIKNGFQVHTHCHSSEALAIIMESSKNNKFTVMVDETRPRQQGLITAKEIARLRNVTVNFGVDSAAGPVLSGLFEKKDDMILVGSDAMRREGMVNKIGTYMLAVVAAENNIPVYVAASTFKLDRRKRIDMENRPENEVYPEADKNIRVRNPSFDITPWKYITAVVTEKGMLKPERIIKMI
jgi:eIF-2B alpha/beta/delta-like uncharacterized protein